MDKSTITIGSVDFLVRTLDARSLPGYESEGYATVKVATSNLLDFISQAIIEGDDDATRIDEQIFFYPDAEFLEADPTDEQLLDYLRLHMCNMAKFVPVKQPEAIDLYSIELDEFGKKQISILGFTYKGDNWKTIDVRGVCLPLEEFVDGMLTNEDYVNVLYDGCREYERDVTDEECVTAINHFFDGKPADYRLRFSDVDIDTPVGNYINESMLPLKVGDKVLWNDKHTPIGKERVWEVFEVREDMVKIADDYSEAEVPWCEVIKLED